MWLAFGNCIRLSYKSLIFTTTYIIEYDDVWVLELVLIFDLPLHVLILTCAAVHKLYGDF